ncbi:hypothetical protein Bca52824_016087 [Brassica carinata]|uniref:Uncharacterized protein n=1 Tax=Brassica carinata TaxID=52824 RepID=A0A8X7W325_BRACI|nr:hypothetical protein Bca52824_016087 [Brassica carinata]
MRKKNLSKTPRTEAKNKPQTPTQLAGETETATTTATLNHGRRVTFDTLPKNSDGGEERQSIDLKNTLRRHRP